MKGWFVFVLWYGYYQDYYRKHQEARMYTDLHIKQKNNKQKWHC